MEKVQHILTPDTPLGELPRARKATGKQLAARISKRAGLYIALIILACFFLFPFFVMICISLLPDADVLAQVLISPEGIIDIGKYAAILAPGAKYMRYLLNSLIVSAICAAGIPLVSSLCAYGFSKLHFHGRDVMFSVVLATLMIPGVITLIPLYAIYSAMGWTDTLLPLFVPSLFGGGATNIFLMRQFFRGIPDDVIAAAKIDGAGTFRIYLQFCLPLCVPVLLFVGYQSFVGAWNNFAAPMMYIGYDSKWIPLALGLYFDYGPRAYGTYANSAMAAGAVMTLPCIVLFIFFQKYLIEGVSVSGMKL
ncbi:MAG: carbohydrate ABC transporter permease [Clostridia bacterium]|nr:carbohydrate ABC transporter permease [Clostridia bacterium]